jgi:succinyl-CoA synthetase beta subunit
MKCDVIAEGVVAATKEVGLTLNLPTHTAFTKATLTNQVTYG